MTTPCFDQFEERAAILEYDEQMTRYTAELLAAQRQGFNSAMDIRKAFLKDEQGYCACPVCSGAA